MGGETKCTKSKLCDAEGKRSEAKRGEIFIYLIKSFYATKHPRPPL